MKIHLLISSCLLTLSCFSQQKVHHITIQRKGSECVINETNKELIPSGRYRNIWTAYDSADKYFVVTGFNGKKGIYALGEKEVVPCIYSDIKMFGNHGFVSNGKKWAVFTSSFKVVSDYIFENAVYFTKEGRSWVTVDSQWVIIDTTGRVIKKIPYDAVYLFSTDDLYKKAGSNNKFGYIDRETNIVIPLEYEDAGIAVSTPIFPVKKNGKWGYVNKKNQVILPFNYGYLTGISQGFGWIRDKRYDFVGLADANGKVIFDDGRYVNVEYAYEGKLTFTQKDAISDQYLQGYLDSATGRVIIPARFNHCDWFYKGRAVVKKNNLSALIDATGKIILPYKYETLLRWGNHYIVSLKGKMGMIDSTGKIITPPEYDRISYSGWLATISKGNLQGIMHYNGKLLISPRYDYIRNITDEIFYAKKDGKNYLVSVKGEEREIE